jgi:hypothetical protein
VDRVERAKGLLGEWTDAFPWPSRGALDGCLLLEMSNWLSGGKEETQPKGVTPGWPGDG